MGIRAGHCKEKFFIWDKIRLTRINRQHYVDYGRASLYIVSAGDDFGFDCNSGFTAACRVRWQLVKNGRSNVSANDNFALAA
jgi:hypothetical protein